MDIDITREEWNKLPTGTYAEVTHSGGEKYHIINGGGSSGASSSGYQICTAGQWDHTWDYADSAKILYTPEAK